jgi:hypothetical protein
MWRRVGILLIDVSEERIASIFRVEEIHELPAHAGSSLVDLLPWRWKIETSINKIPTRRHIPEDGILQFYY